MKQQSCQSNPNESYTERKAMHEPSGYALDLICSFDSKLNKHNFYRGKDCIKTFCSNLKEFGTEIVIYKQKEMVNLTTNDVFFMKVKKYVIYAKEGFVVIKIRKNLKYIKKLENIGITHCQIKVCYKKWIRSSIKIIIKHDW